MTCDVSPEEFFILPFGVSHLEEHSILPQNPSFLDFKLNGKNYACRGLFLSLEKKAFLSLHFLFRFSPG